MFQAKEDVNSRPGSRVYGNPIFVTFQTKSKMLHNKKVINKINK